MGLKSTFKKVKKTFNKVMDKQAEAPYRLQKALKDGWSYGRKKSETFNKFTKGVEKAKKGIKKAYKSKAVQKIGKGLDKLEKVPILGGSVNDVRNFVRGVVKDPFAVKSNLLNFSRMALDLSGEGIAEGTLQKVAEDMIAGRVTDKIFDKVGDELKSRERKAKDRVFGYKGKKGKGGRGEAIPYDSTNQPANMNGLNRRIPNTRQKNARIIASGQKLSTMTTGKLFGK